MISFVLFNYLAKQYYLAYGYINYYIEKVQKYL